MIPNFRAWLKKEKEMIDVDEIHWDRGKFEFIGDGITFQRLANEVEIMQSTGLKDKNGKEIFEGDIVQYQNTKVPSADSKGVIRYFDNWAMFGIDIEHNEPRALFFNGLADHISLEVIGNIYENPELLE
nr:MAG TPA: YopX protein [Caudoviricetes sp.]